MNCYVLGFLFRAHDTQVALIKKRRPAWQDGLLNGIGGHIERDEITYDAMRREFLEETGVEVSPWWHFASLRYPDAVLECFMAREDSIPEGAKLASKTDEPVAWYNVEDIPHLNTIPNLAWLIPLALTDEDMQGFVGPR